jgi:hypothetical protein
MWSQSTSSRHDICACNGVPVHSSPEQSEAVSRAVTDSQILIPMRFLTSDTPSPMTKIGNLVGADQRVCPLFGRTRRCAPTGACYFLECEMVLPIISQALLVGEPDCPAPTHKTRIPPPELWRPRTRCHGNPRFRTNLKDLSR